MSSWTGLLERFIWPFTVRPLSQGSSWITEVSVYPERCSDVWGVLPFYRCWQCGHCRGHGWLSCDWWSMAIMPQPCSNLNLGDISGCKWGRLRVHKMFCKLGLGVVAWWLSLWSLDAQTGWVWTLAPSLRVLWTQAHFFPSLCLSFCIWKVGTIILPTI